MRTHPTSSSTAFQLATTYASPRLVAGHRFVPSRLRPAHRVAAASHSGLFARRTPPPPRHKDECTKLECTSATASAHHDDDDIVVVSRPAFVATLLHTSSSMRVRTADTSTRTRTRTRTRTHAHAAASGGRAVWKGAEARWPNSTCGCLHFLLPGVEMAGGGELFRWISEHPLVYTADWVGREGATPLRPDPHNGKPVITIREGSS